MAQPSQETLDKVARMKARVQATVNNRVQQQRSREERLRQITRKMEQLDMTDTEKVAYLRQFTKTERAALRAGRHKTTLKDFELVKVIGKGAFGEVRIVRHSTSQEVFAMKTMRKKDMIAKNQSNHIQAEKELMVQAVDNDFLVKLFFSFQDQTYLYFVMEYCAGGDFMTILMREDTLSEPATAFYMAELTEAINGVHELGFVHRDLKPDNILITASGHIKLSDFGLAKSFQNQNDSLVSKYQKKEATLTEDPVAAQERSRGGRDKRSAHAARRKDRKLMYSTVGTPDYIAPEVFAQKGYDKMVDWWSMGIIMFETLFGYPPFYAEDPLQTCRRIVHYRKYWRIPPSTGISDEAVDLIQNLVCSHRRRYGYQPIRDHTWFRDNRINWSQLLAMNPPFVPKLSSDTDASQFENIKSDQNMDKFQEKGIKASKTTDKSHFWDFTFKAPVDMQSPEVEAMLAQMEREHDPKPKKTKKKKGKKSSAQAQAAQAAPAEDEKEN